MLYRSFIATFPVHSIKNWILLLQINHVKFLLNYLRSTIKINSIIKILLLTITNYQAFALDDETHEFFKCIKHFDKYENKYFIPIDTLHSIAIKESGKLHSVYKIKMPWPWAVNVSGQGYYFNNKKDAVDFVKSQIIIGKENIDVGCMQVSLKYHSNAFKNLEEAFDPKANIAYAAKFLKSKYNASNNWHKAIAHYHSANFDLGYKYKQEVISIANKMHSYRYLISNYLHNANLVEIKIANTKVSARTKPNYKIKSPQRLKSKLMIPVYAVNK